MDSEKEIQSPLARLWQWSGISDKKGWDWIELGIKLALPIAGIILTFQLSQSAKKEDHRRTEIENQRIKAEKVMEDRRIKKENIAQGKIEAMQRHANEMENDRRRKEEMQFERRKQYESQLQETRMAQEREQFEKQQHQLQSIETRRLQQENNQFMQRQQESRMQADKQNQQTQKTTFAVSQENFRDALLTEYIDQMRHLLIDLDLQKRSPTVDIQL